jgi:hypothetical protein
MNAGNKASTQQSLRSPPSPIPLDGDRSDAQCVTAAAIG